MALSIQKAVEEIKGDVASVLPSDIIVSLCRQLNHNWRQRCLDPVTTLRAFLMQVLHGNTACDQLPRLIGKVFTGEAYCLAQSRLPLELFQRLLGGGKGDRVRQHKPEECSECKFRTR